MAEPAIKERILEDLDRLSPEKQRRVQEFTHALTVERAEGTPGRELLPLLGVIDEQSAREMAQAIEEHCERVDPSEG